MLRVAGAAIVVILVALTACADDSMALRNSEPSYTMVFFASGSTSLGKQAKDRLSDVVSRPTEPIKAVLKPDSAQKICVTGHSDNTGSEAIRTEFGKRRADAVARYLVELGVRQDRLVVGSLGSAKPLVVTPPNTPETANRRVEVLFGCQ